MSGLLIVRVDPTKLGSVDEDLMEIDHKLPPSKGGKDNYDNLQLLHRHCHDAKSLLSATFRS
ncbi:hypothetical protein BWI75_06390 [Gloeocapsopsis sp. AAB1 = 1H9]|uniref:HNH nuclease domain-containing protein n=1 Tax=Gloeocapsopsis dulcis AAB1 = 1H9 TaxID=1433147 RepID=A0A6N8FS85_9CHRO|nr:hypothetical protein [Gloeocapsopsis dulcis AAB1 = 1H9]